MKLPKKSLLVLALALVFGVTIYTNFSINNKERKAQNVEKSIVDKTFEQSNLELEALGSKTDKNDYFAIFSNDRNSVREKEMQYLDEIIKDTSADKETVKSAQKQKLQVAKSIEKEMIIEGLIKAKGFSNVVATIQEGSVNIVVESQDLSSAQVAQILNIAQKESGEKAQNIKIVPKQ